MPHKFIVGREIAPLLVKVRRSGRGAVRHGGVRSVKAVEARSVLVRRVEAVAVRFGAVRSGGVSFGEVRRSR